MESFNEYVGWFRTEAAALPPEVGREVQQALAYDAPRQVFLRLNKLWESKKLPASWEKPLENFYGKFC